MSFVPIEATVLLSRHHLVEMPLIRIKENISLKHNKFDRQTIDAPSSVLVGFFVDNLEKHFRLKQFCIMEIR